MPAYNVASYIDEAVQSVLKQEGISFELLICDDGSKDDTWDKIQKHLQNPKVRAWHFPKNRGDARTRNFLIARAKGKYISCCDADDLFLAGHLKSLVQVLERNRRIGVVYTNMVEIDQTHPLKKPRLLYRRPGHVRTWDLIDGSISNGATLIRRDLIRKIGGYKKKFHLYADIDLFFRLSEITQFHHVSGKPLYVYRRRPDSLSNQSERRRILFGRKVLTDAIQRRYQVQFRWS